MRVTTNTYTFNPSAIEYEFIAWASLKDKSIERVGNKIIQLKKQLWEKVRSLPENYVDVEKCVIDLSMKENGLTSKGKSFIKCSIFLNCYIDWDETVNESFVQDCVENVFESSEYFQFDDKKN